MPTFLTVCINYENENETACFVAQLLNQRFAGLQKILIVDNSRKSEPTRRLVSLEDRRGVVRIYKPGANLGYLNGAAAGLRDYLRAHALPDWTMICNTDLVFTTDTFIADIARYEMPDSGMVLAPAIISRLSKRDQNPHMKHKPSTWQIGFWNLVFSRPNLQSVYCRLAEIKAKIYAAMPGGLTRRRSGKSPRKIYAPHGACMIFHRRYFECGGALQYGAFLFGEEVAIAERVKRLGGTVVYEPDFRIIHNEHATTGHCAMRAEFLAEAMAYLAAEYYGMRRRHANQPPCERCSRI